MEITSNYIDELKALISVGAQEKIVSQLKEMHPADIAEVLDEISLREAQYLYNLLNGLNAEKASDVLMELEEDVRVKFVSSFSAREIAGHLDNLETDDAADLIAELPQTVKDEVLIEIKGTEQGSNIEDLLTYPEDTAGALMAKELIKVNLEWSVLRCVREMRRQAENVDSVYTIYVVDEDNILHGILSLKKLLLTPDREKVVNIYFKDVISVRVDASLEEVSRTIEKYDLVVLPVVDSVGRLLGRITVDDVVDVMREEAKEDYQLMSGISDNIESDDTLWVSSRARLPWLLIAMLGGIVAAQVIGIYEPTLNAIPQLAFFIPLIVGMGGNVGIQSSALIVQGLAGNTLKKEGVITKIIKELGVGLINGLACSILLFAYSYIFDGSLALSLTICISLLAVIIFAAAFGTFMPLMLHRMKFDPALATGPFITTSNDIIGLLFYFLIGQAVYSLLG